MRIALVGAGSLGTIAGALLSKAGLDIVLVDSNVESVNALNERGARITGHMELTTPVKAITPDGMEGTYDLVIYMVKSTFDDAALPPVLDHMGDDSMLITLQNGVPEERVASFVGKERTLGGAVGWGGTWLEPGVSELTSNTSEMTYDIGELDGTRTSRLEMVKEVLDNAGEAIITDNLIGVRWTKLLVNVSMSGLSTVLDCPYGGILDDDKAITAAICIMMETIRASQALGIKMEPMQGADPAIIFELVRQDIENAKGAVRFIWDPHRDIVGSMLQDCKKGMKCEVESLNGYMSRMSAEAGVATPVNDRVTQIIRKIEAGEVEPSFSNLEMIDIPDVKIYFE
ncbi:MAG: ketopantoate reductase family protein [Candidatus Geothermincolia bacterium]